LGVVVEKGGIHRTQEVSILCGLINHPLIFNSRGSHIPSSFNMKTASGVHILTPLWALGPIPSAGPWLMIRGGLSSRLAPRPPRLNYLLTTNSPQHSVSPYPFSLQIYLLSISRDFHSSLLILLLLFCTRSDHSSWKRSLPSMMLWCSALVCITPPFDSSSANAPRRVDGMCAFWVRTLIRFIFSA
jgi:hypothetical protein